MPKNPRIGGAIIEARSGPRAIATKPERSTYPTPKLESNKASKMILVDERSMTRDSLQHMLSHYWPELIIDAVPSIAQASLDSPDIILLNIGSAKATEPSVMPQMAQAERRYAEVPIVILSDHDDCDLAMDLASKFNLRGHIPTSVSSSVAMAAMRVVVAGGMFFPNHHESNKLSVIERESHPDPTVAKNHGLTQREREILKLLRFGKPNKIIAYDLNISENTVKVHMRHIFAKLHLNNRTEAALCTAPLDSPSVRGEVRA